MNMRKIVVVGGFAAGAAFVLAPLASADTDPLAPLVSSEVASMNFLFGTDAFLAGVPSTDVTMGPQGFEIIKPADIPTVQDDGKTLFDFLVYGLNPTMAGLATDPGAYSVFNGAMVPFDDSINSLLYAMMNNGAVLDWDSGDLFGGNSAMDIANSAGSGWEEAANYPSFAWGDLMGYFGIFDS
ncbi:hypothetical protein [Mycolicibacter virginiensis]|uniref:Porin n=1 Tax=Mycolicibacter virginiensis TaxID=1795032 RepID=A0A9X7IKZ7_9MYCO|nr:MULTISPECIES: hypothetical protein [Mycobacteriaceae]PQM51031.1 hypothetical protein C5U48_16925 [Mycolicibacter virginiensis]ULP49044.1 hypothetical protein MJO54_08320 [Mycolicibacter virginiensis]